MDPALNGAIFSSPVLANGVLYIGGGAERKVYALDAVSGDGGVFAFGL